MAVVKSYSYTPAKYTVGLRFHGNGGTAPSDVNASKTSSAASVTVTAKIPSTIPTRSGYNFLGWSGTNGGSVARHPGESINRTFTRQATYSYTSEVQDDDTRYITYHYTTSPQSATLNYYAVWEATGSTVSTTDGTLGAEQTLTITPLDNSYVHTLRYDFSSSAASSRPSWLASACWLWALACSKR